MSDEIIKKALSLPSVKKLELIDKLIKSLDIPDKEIESLWAKEAEERIDAYEKGEIRMVSLEQVLEKYR